MKPPIINLVGGFVFIYFAVLIRSIKALVSLTSIAFLSLYILLVVSSFLIIVLSLLVRIKGENSFVLIINGSQSAFLGVGASCELSHSKKIKE